MSHEVAANLDRARTHQRGGPRFDRGALDRKCSLVPAFVECGSPASAFPSSVSPGPVSPADSGGLLKPPIAIRSLCFSRTTLSHELFTRFCVQYCKLFWRQRCPCRLPRSVCCVS